MDVITVPTPLKNNLAPIRLRTSLRLQRHAISYKSLSISNYLPKPKQHQTTHSNETPQNNPIPPLLTPNPAHQPIDPGYLRRGPRNPPLDTIQTLPLQPKTLVHSIRLTEHTISNIMTPIQPPAFIKHILALGGLGILASAVSADIRADVREEVRAVPGGGDGGFEPAELRAVLG